MDGTELSCRDLVEAVDAIVWQAEASTMRFRFVSRYVESMLGYSRTRWLEDPEFRMRQVHPEDRERVEAAYRMTVEQRRDRDVEYRLVAADGRVIWTRDIVHVIVDAAGRPEHLCGVMIDITDKKRTSAALELSLSVLRATLDATADGILVVGANGRIESYNERFVAMWRIPEPLAASRDDRRLLDFVLDQLSDPRSFLARVRELYGSPVETSLDTIEFRDGRVFERYSRPQRLNGGVIGRVWSFRDVTAQRRAVLELERLNRRHELILDSAGEGIYGLDGEERVTFVNAAAAAMVGREEAALLSRLMHDVVHYARADGTPYPAAECPILTTIREGTVRRVEGEVFWRADGTSFPVDYVSAPVREDGKLAGAVVVFRDITERRAAEAERSRLLGRERKARAAADAAARRFRFLAEASNALASSLDYRATLARVADLAIPVLGDWCVIDVLEDGRFRRIAAASRAGEQERLLRELERGYTPDARSPQPAARVIRTGEPELIREVTNAELHRITRDARHRRIARELGLRSLMAVPITARGRSVGAITLASTRRRYGNRDLVLAQALAARAGLAIDNARLYEATLAASQAKSNFLAVMSHELRTPLNAITGYTDLLRAEIPGPLNEAQKEQLERIKASAWRQLRVIEEVLTFSRMETGEEDIEVHPADLGRLVREAANSAAPLARRKGLEFEVHTPAEPTPVATDPAKVRHILISLLTNAVKFTERGRVELAAELEDGWLCFRVRDTGIGMVSEDRDRIFEPFTQVEAALTREKGGTGLGLSVARRLARLLGGDITVDSEPGKGSTFTVRIPARQPDAASTS